MFNVRTESNGSAFFLPIGLELTQRTQNVLHESITGKYEKKKSLTVPETIVLLWFYRTRISMYVCI